MHIERNVLIRLAIESSTIERCIVRRTMEEKYGSLERIVASQLLQVPLNCSPLYSALISWHASATLLRRDRARWNIPRHVIALPIFQEERSGRNTGIAIYSEGPEGDFLSVHIMPKPLGGCCLKQHFLQTGVVISENQKYLWMSGAQGITGSYECGDQVTLNKISFFPLDGFRGKSGPREEIPTEEQRLRTVPHDGFEELLIPVEVPVQVGRKEASPQHGTPLVLFLVDLTASMAQYGRHRNRSCRPA